MYLCGVFGGTLLLLHLVQVATKIFIEPSCFITNLQTRHSCVRGAPLSLPIDIYHTGDYFQALFTSSHL